jgi:hypothetical protein
VPQGTQWYHVGGIVVGYLQRAEAMELSYQGADLDLREEALI